MKLRIYMQVCIHKTIFICNKFEIEFYYIINIFCNIAINYFIFYEIFKYLLLIMKKISDSFSI